jgi:GST-like protein
MAELTLYHGEPNGPSLTVLAALFEKNLQATLVPIDLAAGERHGGKVPHNVEIDMSIEGEGPVLVADGEAMTDSVFLGLYLDETGTGTPLQPGDAYGQWKVQMWCRYVIERVAPAAALLGDREYLTPKLQAMDEVGFETLVGSIRSADLGERWRQIREGAYPDEQLEDSRTKIRQAVERLEGQLESDWILSDFSLADLETYAWLAGMTTIVPDAFAGKTKTNAWLQRVQARASVQKALAQSRSNDPRRVWAAGPEINRWG